jgi:outer membrane beta-barrel protein
MKRIALILLIVLGSTDAIAKVGSLADAPSVRHQLLLRKARHELAPAVGITLADSYSRSFMFQVAYQYHILDWLAVGAEVSYGVSWQTKLTDRIQEEVSKQAEWTMQNPGRGYQLPNTAVELLTLARVSFVPLSGKMVLFKKYLGYVDFHIDVGGGGARVKGAATDSKFTWALMVGGGLRFWPTTGLSVNLDVKDYMVYRVLNIPWKGEGQESLTQNPTFMAGVSVFLPMTAEYGP